MTCKYLPLWALALTLGLQSPAVAATAVPSNPVDLTYAAENAVNSVVYIKVTTNGKTQTIQYNGGGSPFDFDDFFGDFFGRGNSGSQQRQIQTPKRSGAGSGVILTSDGYIVTNNHVVEDADEMTVKLNDNRESKDRIIGTDKSTDLALIKIEATGLQAIKVGNSDNLKLGEWVLAIGNPFSLTSTVTAGIVSAKARSLNATPGSIDSFIQTDAAINEGNSGGALFNMSGQLIGINSAKATNSNNNVEGMGYAIPISDAVPIIQSIIDGTQQTATAGSAYMGIQGRDLSAYDASSFNMPQGVYLLAVVDGGPAAQAGLQSGDIITALDGSQISSMNEIKAALAKKNPGDTMTVTISRSDERGTYSEQEVTITLGSYQE